MQQNFRDSHVGCVHTVYLTWSGKDPVEVFA